MANMSSVITPENNLPTTIPNKFNKTKFVFWLLLALGIFFRLIHFLENRSLWEDEAWRALWIGAQSYPDIIFNKPFASDLPVMPLGFLLLGKISIQIFGNNEFALRLFPLIFGIANLFLFYALLKRRVSPKAMGVAFGLAIFLDSLIYFSAEFKQYSQDIFVALALYLIFDRLRVQSLNLIQRAVLGLSGALAIFLSHTAIFILATMGILMLRELFFNKAKNAVGNILIIFGYWLVGFIFYYRLVFHGMLGNKITQNMFSQYLWPNPPWSWESLKWLVNSGVGLFQDPLNVSVAWLGAVLTLMGMVVMWRRNKGTFCLFAFPMILVLSASSLKVYPFHGRFLLFMVPNLLLFLAVGTEVVFAKKSLMRQCAYGIILTILFFTPVTSAFQKSVEGRGFEEVRPLMAVLKAHAQPSDKIYVNNEGHFAYLYYLGYFHISDYFKELGKFTNIRRVDSKGECVGISYQEVSFSPDGHFMGFNINGESVVYSNTEKGFGDCARTWVLFSHAKTSQPFVMDFLDHHGQRLGEWKEKGASLYLYDMSLTD